MAEQPAPGSFAEVWGRIPLVTRYLGVLSVVLYGLFLTQFYWALQFWMLPDTLSKGKVWRLFTAPFAYAGDRYSGIFTIFGFCTNLNSLEMRVFKRRSDLIVYIAFLIAFFDVVGPRIGLVAFLTGMANALTYTVCQEAPTALQHVVIIQLKSGLVPWANVLLGLIVAGTRGAYTPLLGIAAAHAYLFLKELLPQAGGPELLGTPQWLCRAVDNDPEAEAKLKTYGQGHRLG